MVVDRGQCCSLVSPLKRFAKSISKNLCIKPRANGRKIVNQYELLHECMSVVWVSVLFFCSKAQCDPYFQVHTRQWACGGSGVTCNCGLALRDHNDVIEFNCCNKRLYFDRVTPIRVKRRSKGGLSPAISVTQTQMSFYAQYEVSLLLQSTLIVPHSLWFVKWSIISLTFVARFVAQSQFILNNPTLGENFKL